MRKKEGIVLYVFCLLVAVGLVIVGMFVTPNRTRVIQDEDEKPPATALWAQGVQDDETG